MEAIRLQARWLFPVDGPPLENGVLEIRNDRITAVFPGPDASAHNLGNVALLPAFVNAHTHLEFSDLSRPLEPATPFAEWLKSLMNHRLIRRPEVEEFIAEGLKEAAACRSVWIGEISTDDVCDYADARCGGVIFREFIGLAPERIPERVSLAREHLLRFENTSWQPGLSPHAPYSVHPDLLTELVRLAGMADVPVAMHIAETSDELELLAHGTGLIRQRLEHIGVWRDDLFGGRTVMDCLEPLASLDHALVVHGNYLTDEQVGFISRRENLHLIYCPRTHAYFQHGPHPWQKMLWQGGQVALGTDSRASSPDLSIWNELLFLRHCYPQVSPEELLRLGTVNGAAALRLTDRCGTLTPGKSAALAAIELPARDSTEPFGLLFQGSLKTLPE